MTQMIQHPRFLILFLFLQLSIVMVFLAPPPPALVFLLSILLVHPNLHCILKLATHTCHLLDHFHFLAIFFNAFSNEYWFGLFVPNIYYVQCNKWVMQLQFVSSASHKLFLGTCRKLFTKFESNIHIIMTQNLYSCMLFFNAQYPTLALKSTSITFICL